MSCRRVRKLIVEYVFGELPRQQQTVLESHLDGCSRCRRALLGLRRLCRMLPDPYAGPLGPGAETWDQVWNRIVEEVSAPEVAPSAPSRARWPTPLRWAATAATLSAAFLVGRHWDDLRSQAGYWLGRDVPSPAGYYTGLDSFQSTSDDYLQRSRLLLLELQFSGVGAAGVDDPWLMDHSRNLLGEAPRLRQVARRIRNPRLEGLLGELETVLSLILETSALGQAALPAELESDLGRLLFKLEMLERQQEKLFAVALPSAS
ncbi:MAG: zf-HC2 domain-containing protein [Acidobacteriota bacterium]